MGIYDCDSADNPNAGNTTYNIGKTTVYAQDEIGEASQYDTATRMYTKPIYFSKGVGVVMSTGVASIIYGPEPN
jgi:hypothetical protein